MKICVLNGSPKGHDSVTMQYVHFLELAFPDHTFIIEDVGQRIHTIETREAEFEKVFTDSPVLKRQKEGAGKKRE
jgi:hypothetical protein